MYNFSQNCTMNSNRKNLRTISLSVLYWIQTGTATIHTICMTKQQREAKSDGKTHSDFFISVAGCHDVHTACYTFMRQTFHCGGWSCFFCRTWAAIRSRSLRPWTVSLRPPSPVFSISFSCSRDCSALRATPPAPRQKCDGHTPFRWRPVTTTFTFLDNGLLTRFQNFWLTLNMYHLHLKYGKTLSHTEMRHELVCMKRLIVTPMD